MSEQKTCWMETNPDSPGSPRGFETVSSRWRRVGCIGLIALLVVSTLPGATKRTIRLPQGTVGATMKLTIDRPVPPGDSFLVEVAEPGVEVALAAPTGETVRPPSILTPAFAVDETALPPKRSGDAALRRIRFRAIEDLPPGDYAVHLSGSAAAPTPVTAAYVPWKDRPLRAPKAPSFGRKVANRAEDAAWVVGVAAIAAVGWPIVGVVTLITEPREFPGFLKGTASFLAELASPGRGRVEPNGIAWQVLRSNGVPVGDSSFCCAGGTVLILVAPNRGKGNRFPVAELTARLVEPDGKEGVSQQAVRIPMSPSREWKGWQQGVFRGEEEGTYQLSATLREARSDRSPRQLVSHKLLRMQPPGFRFLRLEESLIDENLDGRPERWVVSAHVRSARPNIYDATLTLGDETSRAGCRFSRSDQRDPGDQVIRFTLSPGQVRACLPASGRFPLTRLRIEPRQPVDRDVLFRDGQWIGLPAPSWPVLSQDLSGVDWELAPIPQTAEELPPQPQTDEMK